MRRLITALFILLISGNAMAASLLIRNATVHTMTGQNGPQQTDILVEDGKIRRLGSNLNAPADARILDAQNQHLTPGLFGGLSGAGIEEVSLAASSVDSAYQLPLIRPEFQVESAYNPNSSLIGINRIEGITYLLLAPQSRGSIVAGQGGIISLDGGYRSRISTPLLLINIGGDASELTGGSRAAQYMLLQQIFTEAGSSGSDYDPHRLLTSAGRNSIENFVDKRWPVLFDVDRASDILQVLDFAKRQRLQAIIIGGAEAWMVADSLSAAQVPVILNPLDNEPAQFDTLGARLDNAALLHKAGVAIAFTTSDGSHNARKVRQAAGNAVAAGLDWNAALAAITRSPAEIFAYDDDRGSIETGKQADLVLWNGDPLEVTTVATQVIINGRLLPMKSRQTKLRDRYLPENPDKPRAYIKP